MSTIRDTAVDLFTPDEHAVLANWFGLKPPQCAARIDVAEATARLIAAADSDLYTHFDAAVAFIVLERAEARLPQWGCVRGDDTVVLARPLRNKGNVPDRKVVLQPRPLFEINWADSGPGYSWPCAYYVTWVPHYYQFVVTASADSPEASGYCDVALGSFVSQASVAEGAKRIICGDWSKQRDEWDQQRWVYLFGTGLITASEAVSWAAEVWPVESGPEDDAEEDERGASRGHAWSGRTRSTISTG